ncbi:MAG: ABC transporter ATP-binding protein [Nitrososphaerota archaeon]|nr:ABC transporter ATP-binding protein [Nitrososphaerota archaeon]MDG6950704.1 ABC transporter ATP-binding protein [Nitrososphaerota archaeon]
MNKGEIFGFIGPNGSGKTTCIRMLLGLTRPSAGVVRLKGEDPIRRHVQALTAVGYSPELPNMQTFLTPREILALAAAEAGLEGAKEEANRVLEEVGIVEYGDKKVGKLSKGMVQRLSVAQAMVGRPDVMVLDEPMIGLDPAGTAHLREVFREYARSGGTILMSSHMMSEVEDICSVVGLIHSGKLLFNGTTKEMIRQMLGGTEVRVEAKGIAAGAIDAVRNLEGVIKVTETQGGLEVEVSGEIEARPAIAKVLLDSGAELLKLGEGERMLEKAYVVALRGGGDKSD